MCAHLLLRRVRDTLRVHAGYARDRNNMDSAATGRVTAGASLANLAHMGIDASVSQSWIQRPTGAYRATYVSVGRRIGAAAYLTHVLFQDGPVGRRSPTIASPWRRR